MYVPDSDEAKLGEQGESVIEKWLRDNGFFVLPSSDYNKFGAPMMKGKAQKIILPDKLVARSGRSKWVEVKTKSRASWTLKTQRYEHGMPTRHWQDYLKCQEKSGIEGWLAILEIEARVILLACLDDLKSCIRHSQIGGRPHVFFPCDSFLHYNVSDDAVLPDPIPANAIRTKRQSPRTV